MKPSWSELNEFTAGLAVYWETSWFYARGFLNSGFFAAIFGSGAGAFAGAWGAQRIIERGKRREEFLEEIRNTNAAIMAAMNICNLLIGIKGQYVKSLKNDFNGQRTALLEHKAKRERRQLGPEVLFHFKADLRTLSLPPLPLSILQQQVFEKLSVIGRPLLMVNTLSQTVHGLSTSLERRNQLVEQFRANGLPPDQILVPLYFGLPQDSGHVDTNYYDVVHAIYSQTDDGIFFSRLLCDDLVEHGKSLKEKFTKRFGGKDAPVISRPSFPKPEEQGLMPDNKNYESWLNMFVKEAPRNAGRHPPS